MLPRRYRERFGGRQGRHSPHLRVYHERYRHRDWRGLSGIVPRPNPFLPQGAEQEKAEQPQVVLQRFRPSTQAQWSVPHYPRLYVVDRHLTVDLSDSLHSP